MKTLLRSIAILMLLLGISILLPVQHRAHADTLDCYEDFNLTVSDCVGQQVYCWSHGGSTEDCTAQYNRCLEYAAISKSDCEAVQGGNALPWPVIDFSLSVCLSGCQGCNDLEDPSESLACLSQCQGYCLSNYPRH